MTKVVKKTKIKKNSLRLLVLPPLCLCIIVFVFITLGDKWIKISNIYQEQQALEEQIISLKEEEAGLKVDVDRLEDPDYVARYAREKFMYSKDGELIIRLPEEDK